VILIKSTKENQKRYKYENKKPQTNKNKQKITQKQHKNMQIKQIFALNLHLFNIHLSAMQMDREYPHTKP